MNTTANSLFIPDDRYYDRIHHTWAHREAATGRIVVGIDRLGLQALGDIVYLTLKSAGSTVQRGEAFGTFEAAKMIGELISPVSGTITQRNEEALRNPGLINQDPYGKGWLIVLDPIAWQEETEHLIFGDALPAWIESELERYRSQGWL